MKRKTGMLLSLAALLLLCGCCGAEEALQYERAEVHPVAGRQGVCAEGGYFWVSGSAALAKYDEHWQLVAENTDPFAGYPLEVNHIGDIDVYQNELYLGVEYFLDGQGKNIQVAVYDGDTLKLKRVFPFRADTGQKECSGIAVDPDSRTVYMTSWIGDESSEYLYRYDLDTGDYKGKTRLQPFPQWMQGVAYFDGSLYITSDDGDADGGAPDHLYRVEVSENGETGAVRLEKTLDDVIRQGEIEGLTFDKGRGQLLVLYNRGARIVAGMPVGFYEGYSEEIHEVFVYDVIRPASSPEKSAPSISYLGPAGTYTEEAAQLFFPSGDFRPEASVPDAIAAVKAGKAEYAVIPQENTLGGAVLNYVDALIAEKEIYVVGEVILPISQTLMALPGASLEDIREVCSHAQGIVQSAAWRKEHLPDAVTREMASTAAAASYVSASGDPSVAAIAAPGAATLYGLSVLAENVQITDTNKTRFYVLSAARLEEEAQTNAVFVASCEANRIDDILVEIHQSGAELVTIHDRPEGSRLGTYRYIIEVTGEDGLPDGLLAGLEAMPEVRFLGSFRVIENK